MYKINKLKIVARFEESWEEKKKPGLRVGVRTVLISIVNSID